MELNKLTFFFSIGASLLFNSAFANEIPVRVILSSIEAVKISEKNMDELYFDITQYSNQGRAKTSRIPDAPLHWLSKQLPEVKNVTLWEGVIHTDEEMKVIISLVEQDAPPWDVDDMIGSALLVLEQKEGRLNQRWELPVFEERVSQEMLESNNPQAFLMRGENSHYKVAFKVEEVGVAASMPVAEKDKSLEKKTGPQENSKMSKQKSSADLKNQQIKKQKN